MAENKTSISESLEFSKIKTINFEVQSSPHHQSDHGLIEYIHDAVAGLD